MRKMMVAVAAFAFALGVSGTAFAATLSNLNGQSCGDDTGFWHFVNNQTGSGAAAGHLTATFSSGQTCEADPSAVLNRTQHFHCEASGTLESASTNLAGRLAAVRLRLREEGRAAARKSRPRSSERLLRAST